MSASSAAGPSGEEDPYIEAVYDYVSRGDPELTADQRKQVQDGRLVQEIAGWPLQDRIKHHKLFAYQLGLSEHAFRLVMIDSRRIVAGVNDREDINALLRDEGLMIKTPEEAREVAGLFLNCYFVTGVLDFGWELGINVLKRADDILFKSDMEKAQLTAVIKIQPPTLVRDGSSYRYVLYGWDRIGAGSLWKYEVGVNEKGIANYKRTKIRASVGAYQDFM